MGFGWSRASFGESPAETGEMPKTVIQNDEDASDTHFLTCLNTDSIRTLNHLWALIGTD
jgi:hypothetical protein